MHAARNAARWHVERHPAGEDVKPFTPEKAKAIVMSLQQPAVFCNMAFDWPALRWNPKYLSEMLDGKTIQFRLGMKKIDAAPQFETECSYVQATLEEFLAWSSGLSSCFSGPFSCYDSCKYWAYADYKYIAKIFEDKTEIFQDVIWSDFGFPGRNGRESTLWIGSVGANTPCHLDSYGCNLVLQVQGRKRWHLFPPSDACFLYPTRIPYEESSVFSKVSVVNPDLKRFPLFKKAKAHVVTLSPGQVLFVPQHWWHYVESIDPITISINSWIELVEATSHEINLQYLNGAMSAYLEYQKAGVLQHRYPSRHRTERTMSASCKRRKTQVMAEPEDNKEADFPTAKRQSLQADTYLQRVA
ncbi:HSPB1-associated protein 1 isoform B [Alligator mississippiensis]|uniref:HSPB1-associated protein 1 n=1 Tax=Alligator mississippiensis TaxID=8496 RepID=A0A151M0Z6_ALLMI|nr:HSPB1-associated protein 1 isoform B [Alligator mississippiensis]